MQTKAFFRPGNYYLIFNHSNGGEIIFKKDANYYYFLKKHGQYMDDLWQLISYCILPDSYVMLIRVKENFEGMHWHEINKTIYMRFGHFTNAYAKAFNKSYTRRGSVFARRFRRTLIDQENMKLEIINIHQLPVRHQFVTSSFEWKFSSCNKVYGYSHDSQLKHMLTFFENRENFIALHTEKNTQDVAA
ncbi:MAG: hypothetical protein ABIQ40_10095 [Bacteroidia bacterium]